MDDIPPPAPLNETDDLRISPIPRKRKLKVKKRKLIPPDRRTKLAKNSPYLGMTQMNCANDCTPQSCVISHRGYCAHPYKGSLQRIDQNDLGAINRLNEAKQFLGPPKRI